MLLLSPLPTDRLAGFLESLHADAGLPESWLVFADWLEDHGDPRSELIRLQGERLLLNQHDPEYQNLREREADWLRRHLGIWPGEVPAGIVVSWVRGLLKAEMPAESFRVGLPDWLDQALAVGWVQELTLTFSSAQEAKRLVAGKVGKRLDSVTRLPGLALKGPYVCDSVVGLIKPLTQLRRLDIKAASLKQEALRHIRRLTQLTALRLPPRTWDWDLQQLQRLTRLQELDLTDTQITDVGFLFLRAFVDLRMVCLNSFQDVTDEAVKRLQRDRPNLRIIDPWRPTQSQWGEPP